MKGTGNISELRVRGERVRGEWVGMHPKYAGETSWIMWVMIKDDHEGWQSVVHIRGQGSTYP